MQGHVPVYPGESINGGRSEHGSNGIPAFDVAQLDPRLSEGNGMNGEEAGWETQTRGSGSEMLPRNSAVKSDAEENAQLKSKIGEL